MLGYDFIQKCPWRFKITLNLRTQRTQLENRCIYVYLRKPACVLSPSYKHIRYSKSPWGETDFVFCDQINIRVN